MTGTLIAPGAVHMRQRLTLDEQRDLVAQCIELGAGAAGFYTPAVRGGHPMSVKMLCLGRHWNARTYRYEMIRSDIDQLPVQPLPLALGDLARAIAQDAGFELHPDLCIVNWYSADSRMGLHQDKDESASSLSLGLPVVSLSLGDTARFLFGGLKRRDPIEQVLLHSGDAFVFGGAARLRHHGVSGIIAGTGPSALGFSGRLNLTFRQF